MPLKKETKPNQTFFQHDIQRAAIKVLFAESNFTIKSMKLRKFEKIKSLDALLCVIDW